MVDFGGIVFVNFAGFRARDHSKAKAAVYVHVGEMQQGD